MALRSSIGEQRFEIAAVDDDPDSILAAAVHRSEPLPRGRWLMAQRWTDLLFMHWPVSSVELGRWIPARFAIDTFDDRAWLGITPFAVRGLRARGLPAIPGMSSFPEVNVRTYVRLNGKPGVFFCSLDAGSRLAVEAARLTYALPYFRASMRVERRTDRILYDSRRTDTRAPAAALDVEYHPTGPIELAPKGSLAHWLTERYRLFALRDRRIYEAEIHHRQWPLQSAAATIHVNTMADASGITLPTQPPLLHFSSRLDVLVWPPRRVH